jgi:hypothetical protein
MSSCPQDRDNSPSSCAGLFIASHIGFDWPGVWVHLDIAAPVHAVSASGLLLFPPDTSSLPPHGLGHSLPPTLFLQSSSEPLLSSSVRFCVLCQIICGPASSQLQSL